MTNWRKFLSLINNLLSLAHNCAWLDKRNKLSHAGASIAIEWKWDEMYYWTRVIKINPLEVYGALGRPLTTFAHTRSLYLIFYAINLPRKRRKRLFASNAFVARNFSDTSRDRSRVSVTYTRFPKHFSLMHLLHFASLFSLRVMQISSFLEK